MSSDYQFNYTDKDPKLLTVEYHINLEIALRVFSAESSAYSKIKVYKVV